MRTHGRVPTLSVNVCGLVSIHPAPTQQIPPGNKFLTNARVSGALLANTQSISGGAGAPMRIRNARTVRDTHTGERADVHLGHARDTVPTLNERKPGGCRDAPL